MIQYRGAPWKTPNQLDSSGRLKPTGVPSFFENYLRLTQLPSREVAQTGKLAGLKGTSFVQCEENPGVALDRFNNKYKLLMVENGQAKTVGRFHVPQEGIEGISGYNDMQTKGPLGIMGVPASVGNIGPPGVALLPKINGSQLPWQTNARNRPDIDEGNCADFGKMEKDLAAERFKFQRLGSELANRELIVASDTFKGEGRHAAANKSIETAVDILRPSTSLKSAAGTSYNKIYDERGLTLVTEPCSMSGRHSTESYPSRSLAVTMARPARPFSFREVPFRPASTLLKDKGHFNARAPDHNKNWSRPDLIGSLARRGFSTDTYDQKALLGPDTTSYQHE
jgi:hypothetical protein